MPHRLGPGIAVAILVLATVAHAGSSLETIRARGVLRVGVKSDAPPFSSLGARGRPVGFEIDRALFFARVLFDDDRRVELVPVTTATRFGVLQSGRVDLVAATITATDERRNVAELSEPYFMSASLILVPLASKVERLADLGDQRVAVVRGSVQEGDVSARRSFFAGPSAHSGRTATAEISISAPSRSRPATITPVAAG